MSELFDEPRGPIPASTETVGSSEVTSPGTNSDPSTRDTADTAKEQARSVAQDGVQGGKHVASVAADQAKEVASEAGNQAQALLAEAKSELLEQVASGKDRVAEQLHTLAKELGSMASKSDQDGLASGLAGQASRQVGTVAHWVSEREPGSLVGELKNFARAKPGTFLAVAAGIGLVAGRMTRGAQAGPADRHVGPPDQQVGPADQRLTSPPVARPGMASVGSPGVPSGTGPVPGSVEGVGDVGAGDPTVGVGTLYPDMVSDEPLPSHTPWSAR